jgi:hypothetical protein
MLVISLVLLALLHEATHMETAAMPAIVKKLNALIFSGKIRPKN